MRHALLTSLVLLACHNHQPKKVAKVEKKAAQPSVSIAPAPSVNIYLTVNGESVHLQTDSGQHDDSQFDIERRPKPPDNSIIPIRPAAPIPASPAQEPVRISAADYTLVGVISFGNNEAIGWFRRPGQTETLWKTIGGGVGQRGGVLKNIVGDTAEIEEEGKVIRLSVFGFGLMSQPTDDLD